VAESAENERAESVPCDARRSGRINFLARRRDDIVLMLILMDVVVLYFDVMMKIGRPQKYVCIEEGRIADGGQKLRRMNRTTILSQPLLTCERTEHTRETKAFCHVEITCTI